MNRKELLIEIGQRATKSQLEAILEDLIRRDESTSARSNDWTLEDQLKYSHEQSELVFRELGVHWDQQSQSSGYGFSTEEITERILQRGSLSKKGSNYWTPLEGSKGIPN